MPVRDFRDLVCWQLSYELRREVFAFTATGPAARDFKFRDQIRDSSASAPRNIAEGFGRYLRAARKTTVSLLLVKQRQAEDEKRKGKAPQRASERKTL